MSASVAKDLGGCCKTIISNSSPPISKTAGPLESFRMRFELEIMARAVNAPKNPEKVLKDFQNIRLDIVSGAPVGICTRFSPANNWLECLSQMTLNRL